MTISYNWLKEYLSIDLPATEVADILTDIGLEVEKLERVESVKGGLEGVVIGEVLTCEPHPNADRLKITSVNVGTDAPLQIVCGAPNVAAGQKVAVATIGTTLFGFDEPLKIKKGKIRGAVSEGMICAEDELGLGSSHDGILVLNEQAVVGQAAAEYFKLEVDEVFEIGLTPNRTDAMSHFGVARDLRAALQQRGVKAELQLPEVVFKVDSTSKTISVRVDDVEGCPQYMGVTICDVKVSESPDWLQNRLRAIGLKPINNVVDVTNFVLHEIGHPLHAFDADAIEGGEVIIKNLPADTTFETLDGVVRKLDAKDLMICNRQGGMCIAGVFGGKTSGVTQKTTSVFLESAYFNPVRIRKTAKRHALNTDASYRYERGVDPNMTAYALKRAAMLIAQLTGGTISSEIQISKNKDIKPVSIHLNHNYLNGLIGNEISAEKVEEILEALEFSITPKEDGWLLKVPTYRVDVTRPADVVEEFLRIYGFNNVKLPQRMHISTNATPNDYSAIVKAKVDAFLPSVGFYETINNSLTKVSYYQRFTPDLFGQLVHITNPLSQDLGVMRQHMLFGGLEVVSRNINRQQQQIKLYEFGKVYAKRSSGAYLEEEKLAFFVSGYAASEQWQQKQQQSDYYLLKGAVAGLLSGLGILSWQENVSKLPLFNEALQLQFNGRDLGYIAEVDAHILKEFDIDQPVYYAELNWKELIQLRAKTKILFAEMPKYPAVRRDLALLLDNEKQYSEIQAVAKKAGGKLVTEINLFDVYKGKNLPEGKKSYAVSFMLQDPNATLTDRRIDETMSRILSALENKMGAQLR